MTAVAPRDGQASESAAGADALLIDTDVHESLSSPLDLKPYLDAHWQQYWDLLPQPIGLPSPKSPYGIPAHAFARDDWRRTDGAFATGLGALRRHLFDELGVSIAILNNISVGFGAVPASPEYNIALARAYTDWVIAEWLDNEPRLRGSVYVCPFDPVGAAAEIDRAAAHPQIVQVFLPLLTDREYGDPFYRPIFEAAVRNELVVVFHHGAYTRASVGWHGWPRYYIQWHNTAQVHATQDQVTSLVCNGLFDRYSDLKVVFLESGVGWVTPFIWRFDQQFRELRSEIPWVKRLPSEHILEHVRFSTQPMGDLTSERFRSLVEMGGTERLFMFSTDYPHYDADSPDVVLPRTLPEDLRRRVRYKNALETYPRLAGLSA